METSGPLTAEEILGIIKQGAKSNVKKITYGSFLVEFFGQEPVHQHQIVLSRPEEGWQASASENIIPSPVVTVDDAKDDPEAVAAYHELREELRLADLMINDPVAYEQEMMDAQQKEEG